MKELEENTSLSDEEKNAERERIINELLKQNELHEIRNEFIT